MNEHDKHKIGRQAVVIIHGLGEQRPMATLRSFVEGMTAWRKKFNPDEPKPRYWSRPDGISDRYETRRITMEETKGNPKTDFYEFYWAHHMRNTSLSHLVPWLWKLISSSPARVPPRLKSLQRKVWFILVLAAVSGLLFYLFRTKIQDFLSISLQLTATMVAIFLVIGRLVLWVVKVPFSQFVLNTAGDAARYFNPMPSNIEERSTIRREGIAFLRKLHERKEKPYDRIIVVSHSLGTVVAYDMIRLLWHEMHEQFNPVETLDYDVFDRMDAICNDPARLTDVDTFQNLQHDCWHQYRANGNPWLITDFITCAGAIAHADFYLLGKVPFTTLVKQKEFPICPPVMEGSDRTLFFDEKTYEIEQKGGTKIKRTIKFLNHGAPFALTRWTNIFFSSDYIGSDAKRVFCSGVKDVEIQHKNHWLFPSGHTNYWDAQEKNKALTEIARAIGFV